MGYETLLCDVRDQAATVTMNRPKVLHALNTQVFDELETVFQSLAADSAVRVILLTGSGEKAFAAGADINELVAMDAVTGLAKARRGQAVLRFIETCGKPVIALINGFAGNVFPRNSLAIANGSVAQTCADDQVFGISSNV